MKRLILFLLITIITINGQSQKFEFEGSVGYSHLFIPSNGDHINGFQISGITNFYPTKAFFFLSSGFIYQNEDEWNFLKLPVNLTFSLGKQVSFLFGGGLCINYIMLSSKYFYKYDILSKSDFTFNYILLVGVSFQVSKNLKLVLKPEYEGSFTTLYKSFGGHHGFDYNKFSSYSINIGVCYKLKNKKTEAYEHAASMRGL